MTAALRACLRSCWRRIGWILASLDGRGVLKQRQHRHREFGLADDGHLASFAFIDADARDAGLRSKLGLREAQPLADGAKVSHHSASVRSNGAYSSSKVF